MKMVVEKEDLGLSLSLNFPEKRVAVTNHLNNLMMPNSSSPSLPSSISNKASWTQGFSSSDGSPDETCGMERTAGSFLKGIDVNCLPTAGAEEEEEEGGLSSPNSTISSVSGKRSYEHDGDGDRACSRGISDEEDADNSRNNKKLRLSKDQSAVLEETFKDHNTLNPKQKMGLAKRLGLRPRQVEVWFQNRRARTKLKQTEVDCEYLKRCYENLTEENRRLQKEVQQLRALKLSPQFYMQMTPPTTLTVCPSCERLPTLPSMVASTPRPIMSFNPWAATPIPHRPFDALHSARL